MTHLLGEPLLGLLNTDIIYACGLFAFIGDDPSVFSWDKFNILGCFNDTRGGDACGRVFGDTCQHGTTGVQKTYKEFTITNRSPNTINTHNTILGHCRKASVGGFNEIYAQPIILRKSDINFKNIKDTQLKKAIKELDPTDIVFSGIHNGTISNYRELAPKYGIPTEDHNDSKVLLTALFYGNIDILSKYIGTAAVVWHNHVFNKTYIFKGESSTYSEVGITMEERPLYCWCIEGGMYISSIDDSLFFIGAEDDDVIDLATNIVFVYRDGVKQKSIKIDRSKASHYAYTPPAKTNYNKGSWKGNYYDREYEGDDLPFSKAEDEYSKKGVLALDFKGGIKGPVDMKESDGITVRLFDFIQQPFRLQAEINNSCTSNYPRSVVFNKGRYWMSGGLMHGVYLLNSIGQVPQRSTKDVAILKLYYFIEGIMLDNVIAYNKARIMHGDFMNDCYNDINTIPDLELQFTKQIVKYSRFPTCSLLNVSGIQDIYSTIYDKNGLPELYDGTFHPLFSNRKYICKLGTLSLIMTASTGIKSAISSETDTLTSDEYYDKCLKDKSLNEEYLIGFKLIEHSNDLNPLSPLQSLIYSLIDFSESPSYKAMLVHYLRDFVKPVKAECQYCPNAKLHNYILCTTCKSAINGLKTLQTLAKYGTRIGEVY